MNKVTSAQKLVSPKNAKSDSAKCLRAFLRAGVIAALGVASAFAPPTKPQAQRARERGANVTGVSSSRQGGSTVVSVSGEGAMSRVQTWQDPDGKFHVVFPNGKSSLPGRMPGGVKVQRVGDSVELIVPTKPGASVRVQPRANSLDLVVDGGFDEGGAEETRATRPESSYEGASRAQSARERGASEEQRRPADGAARRAAGGENAAQKKEGAGAAGGDESAAGAGEAGGAQQPQAQAAGAAPESSGFIPEVELPTPGAEVKPADAAAQATGGDAMAAGASFMLSLQGMLMLVAVAALGGLLFFVRRRGRSSDEGGKRSRKSETSGKSFETEPAEETKDKETLALPAFEPYRGDRRKQSVPVAQERRRGTEEQGMRYNVMNGALKLEGANDKLERRPEARPAMPASGVPAVMFGAYRVDQEVGKLVQGLPHSIEVLASRATDDRRAIETSLVKALGAADTSEEGRRRVRQALEDYGFMARQSAALLLSADSYERVSAARILGQVKSTSSLPFLLEALYDAEGVVRTEVVSSLGALGLPQAIGALIDMARRYPEVPAALLAPALTACSFEAQEWSWVSQSEGGRVFTLDGGVDHFAGESYRPETSVDAELPEWLEDESLADALERLESADVEARVAAAQSLSQFPAKRSVEALTAILVRDANSAVRAAAVTSLGTIDHESVFAPVLFALADEAREVRAAAARAYSGVNFDRADATARIIETADRETLEDLARACVKAGLAAQAISRLGSEDRRHAFEAYTLLSLVVRGGETAPILEAVEGHRDLSVRVGAVRLASLTGDPQLLKGLRELAGREGLPDGVRVAIQEAVEQGAQVR